MSAEDGFDWPGGRNVAQTRSLSLLMGCQTVRTDKLPICAYFIGSLLWSPGNFSSAVQICKNQVAARQLGNGQQNKTGDRVGICERLRSLF
jgi:hypothetical protein